MIHRLSVDLSSDESGVICICHGYFLTGSIIDFTNVNFEKLRVTSGWRFVSHVVLKERPSEVVDDDENKQIGGDAISVLCFFTSFYLASPVSMYVCLFVCVSSKLTQNLNMFRI